MKFHDTNILDRLTWMLRNGGGITETGGYSGFVKFIFKHRTSTQRTSTILAYHHGGGGNAMRSKDVLSSQLDAMVYSNADIIVSGHTHNKIHDPSNVSYYINQHDNIQFRRVDWMKLGNYKRNETDPLMGGYEVEKKFMPKDVGGYWIEFCNERTGKKKDIYETVRRVISAD